MDFHNGDSPISNGDTPAGHFPPTPLRIHVDQSSTAFSPVSRRLTPHSSVSQVSRHTPCGLSESDLGLGRASSETVNTVVPTASSESVAAPSFDSADAIVPTAETGLSITSKVLIVVGSVLLAVVVGGAVFVYKKQMIGIMSSNTN